MIIRQSSFPKYLSQIEIWFSNTEQLHSELTEEQIVNLLEKWALIKEQLLYYDNKVINRRK